MKKRILALLLGVIMVVGLLAGCAKKKNTPTTNKGEAKGDAKNGITIGISMPTFAEER